MVSLPETTRGRPRQESGLHDTTTAVPTIADPAALAALLELSDERDQHERRRLAAERRAYLDGYRDGADAGRRFEADEMAARWNAAAKPIACGGPTFAELQRRRGVA